MSRESSSAAQAARAIETLVNSDTEQTLIGKISANVESVKARSIGHVADVFQENLGLCERVKVGDETWLVSLGHHSAPEEGHDTISIAKQVFNKRTDEDDPRRLLSEPFLIAGKTPVRHSDGGNILSTVAYGQPINNDMFNEMYNSPNDLRELEHILSSILSSSGSVRDRENDNKARQKSSRNRSIGRWARRTIVLAATAASAVAILPNAINEVDEFQDNQADRELVAAEAKAEAEAQAQAIEVQAKQERISIIEGFDSEYATLDGVQLAEGQRIQVVSSEQLDTASVPEYSTAPEAEALQSDLTNIRSFELPGVSSSDFNEACETYTFPIPEATNVTASHNADPDLFILATQDALSETVKVCMLNPDGSTIADIDPTTDFIETGDIHFQFEVQS